MDNIVYLGSYDVYYDLFADTILQIGLIKCNVASYRLFADIFFAFSQLKQIINLSGIFKF